MGNYAAVELGCNYVENLISNSPKAKAVNASSYLVSMHLAYYDDNNLWDFSSHGENLSLYLFSFIELILSFEPMLPQQVPFVAEQVGEVTTAHLAEVESGGLDLDIGQLERGGG